MATTLPLPIEFRMPDDWRPAAPDEVGAPAAAFVALIPDPARPDEPGAGRPDARGPGAGGPAGFTANVTVDGEVPPASATLADIADRSVDILRELGTGVTVLDRAEVGLAAAPALTQTVRLTMPGSPDTGGADRELVAAQVYLSMHDVHDPTKRAVIRLALTATAAQARAIIPDFQWFVSTVRPDSRPSDPD